MEAVAWAREQFWGSSVPDLRLQRRLVEVAACIRDNPCGTLPQAIGDRMALKGAYRMLGNPKMTHDNILQPHVKATRARCHEPGEYLLLEDTTALSFTQREPVMGMGPLTQEGSQGFLAHTNLAVRVDSWSETHKPEVVLMGVFGQQCWAREMPQGTRTERKQVKRVAKRTGAPSESARWARALREAGSPGPGARWTLVADRECDIFEVIAQCAVQGIGWVIRAAQSRKTTPLMLDVFAAAAQAPVLGTFTLELRARPGVAARGAHVEIRAIATALAPPRESCKTYAPQAVTLVHVRELEPPEGVEPLHWVLLTSWPCETYAQARRACAAYACRWLIEEYHKVLKTGTHIEESQLSTADRIEALLAIHAVVAADLLALKLLAHTHPDDPVPDEFLAPESLIILERRVGRPPCDWTYASTLRAVARMGGYLGRKNDGPPGWLSIWRGWLRLMILTEGYILASQIGKDTYG